jgi:hypothetical protein
MTVVNLISLVLFVTPMLTELVLILAKEWPEGRLGRTEHGS